MEGYIIFAFYTIKISFFLFNSMNLYGNGKGQEASRHSYRRKLKFLLIHR